MPLPWLAVLSSAMLFGCSAARPSAGRVDDLGHLVRLSPPARRVVSLAPSLTELLFAIGAGERVVGRTKWDEYPPSALAVPSVGDGLAPNVEAVAARHPDLVLLYASPSNAAAVQQLDALGIAAASYHMDRLADVSRLARVVGRWTGDSARADSLAGVFDRGLDSARAVLGAARGTPPRVLLLAWNDPPNVLGATSFLSEIVTLAGGRNAFADIPRPSATVTIETIAERNPDVILAQDSSAIARLAGRPEWQAVRAVRQRRFVIVHGTEFGQPSFRALAAAAQLREALRAAVQ